MQSINQLWLILQSVTYLAIDEYYHHRGWNAKRCASHCHSKFSIHFQQWRNGNPCYNIRLDNERDTVVVYTEI